MANERRGILTSREPNRNARTPGTMTGQDSRVDGGRIDTYFSPGREHQRRMLRIIQS